MELPKTRLGWAGLGMLLSFSGMFGAAVAYWYTSLQIFATIATTLLGTFTTVLGYFIRDHIQGR